MISVQTILRRQHDPANFSELCRLCGKLKSPALSIYDLSYRTSYQDIINFYFKDLQISKTDVLPSKLCNDCAKFITSWHRFHKSCVQVNKALLSAVDEFRIQLVESESKTLDDKSDIEVIEMDVDSIPHDLDQLENLNNTEKSSNKLPETSVETMIDEIYPAEDATESKIICNNDIVSKVLTTMTYVADPTIVSHSENLLPNQQTSQADEFLVDVAELSGSSKSKSKTAIGQHDEVIVLFPEPQNDSLLKGFILNDTTSQYHCSSCFKAHVTKEELLKHICTEHKTNIGRSEMYECDMCSQLFVKNIHRNTHRFNVHNISVHLHKDFKVVRTNSQTTPGTMEPDDDESFHCEYCDVNFNRLGKLKVHKMHKHGVIYRNIRRCNICSMVLLNKRALRLHIKTAHTRVPVEDAKTKITISEEYLQYLSKRIVYEGETRYFQCEDCLYKCRGLHQFVRHGKRHVNANPTCAYCDKSFAAKGLLQRHITSVHLNIKEFECNVCGKMFNEKRHMQEHMILHQDVYNYICEVCGKQFKQRQSLAVHKQVHRGEKSFPCEFCDKAFTFKTKLSNHMKRHTGKNLSVCQLCAKKFTSSTHLKAHMLSHLDVKPFPCTVCGKNLKTNRSFKRHMIIFHSTSKQNVMEM